MRSNDPTHISLWIPLSMLAVTTVALALPFALFRRQQRTANSIIGGDGRTSFLLKSTSKLNSSPPVRRRAPAHHGGITVPSAIPLSSRGTDGASAKVGSVFRTPSGEASLRVSSAEKDGSFNGALFSLKAFSIATALVVAGGGASVWSVKTYLDVKDAQEFASAMRETMLDKWPLLTSRILHPSPSNSSSSSHPDPLADPDCRDIDVNNNEDWNWPAAQARLVAAYECGGIAQFAEVAARELEAELELERRKRRIGDS